MSKSTFTYSWGRHSIACWKMCKGDTTARTPCLQSVPVSYLAIISVKVVFQLSWKDLFIFPACWELNRQLHDCSTSGNYRAIQLFWIMQHELCIFLLYIVFTFTDMLSNLKRLPFWQYSCRQSKYLKFYKKYLEKCKLKRATKMINKMID